VTKLSPPEILALLKHNLPVEDQRGEIIEEISTSHLRIRLPIIPDYLSHDLPPGSGQAILSAPIAMGFADTAMYACIHTFYGADVLAVIVNFNVSFLSIAGNADATAVATLLRKGKSLAFVEARLFSGSSTEPFAQVTATYAIRDIQDEGRKAEKRSALGGLGPFRRM
jgi:acyl-coenzyme A thioesterase PaaI-like protein